MSARHVLLGHMRQFPCDWKVTVIVPCSGWQSDWNESRWNVIESPPIVSKPIGRWAWERKAIPRFASKLKVDLVFSPNGIVLSRCPVPQVTLAQNPWCLTPTLHNGYAQKIRALIQRRSYRSTQLCADSIAFNSQFMQNAYRENAAGSIENRSVIAYQGINEERFEAAERHQNRKRNPLTIVSVSAMARWKGADRLVMAVNDIHQRGIRAVLRLVGPWPEAQYRKEVESLIHQFKLEPYIQITDRVSDEQLDIELASAKVYALLSQCESFGIPAVEAQAFGTPVVGSTGTAMPEVGGDGGVFVKAEDIAIASNAIERLLTDDCMWKQYSDAAKQNAEKFRWNRCSQPLIQLLEASH